MERDLERKYEKNGVTVFWKPSLCTHSAICIQSLPKVFNFYAKPWINLTNATLDEIKETIDQCPSMALSYEDINDSKETSQNEKNSKIEIIKNGPLLVSGDFKLIDMSGIPVTTEKKISLCRCGFSENKPFCDGAHINNNFNG